MLIVNRERLGGAIWLGSINWEGGWAIKSDALFDSFVDIEVEMMHRTKVN